MYAIFAVVPLFLFVIVALPIIALVRMGTLRRRVEYLEAELAKLRADGRGPGEPPIVPTPVAAMPADATPATAWTPSQPPPAPAFAHAAVPPAPAPPPAYDAPFASVRAAPREPAADATHEAPGRPLDVAGLEQLIGGVWLQNLGAVVLLLGVFLMIVWGYTTGRLGPQVLVAGGVALGLALAWRGDRTVRRMPRFGYALIGLGLGVVYLTLYLGFIRLHVMGPVPALSLLVLVSFGAIATGLRHRVQLIAALGVVGAFLPQFMAQFLGLSGFTITPGFLLGYLAAVDLVVFALAARAGWSALNLSAVALTLITWMATFYRPQWGWGIQIGLTGLFAVMGLAPLPRLVRVEGRVRALDLAVVAATPLAMLLASAPFLSWASRPSVAMLLMAVAVLYLAAALWVDSRRPERDLWVPLTAAASLFLAGALERATGPVYTALSWTAEGVTLILLGLRARGGWLRLWGSAVLAAGACAALSQVVSSSWTQDQWPVFYGEGLRTLACTAAVLFAAWSLARRRAELVSVERVLSEVWLVMGNLLLMVWLGYQASHVATAVSSPGAHFHPLPPPVGLSLGARRDALMAAVMSAAWMAQALVLTRRGTPRGGALRICGAAIALASIAMLGLQREGDWWTDMRPIVHAASLLDLLAIAMTVWIALRVAAHRGAMPAFERQSSHLWSAAAMIMLMIWSVRESAHLAQALLRPDALPGASVEPALAQSERALGAGLASAALLLEGIAVLVLGWRRESAFLRWSGLVLLGLTLFKFVIVDLRTVDVFWRFLTAIAVGAAMLAFSYAYQRRARAGRAAR